MHHLRQLPRFIALLAIAVLTAGMGTAGAAGTEGFEGFASGQSWPDGSIHGTWRAVYDGYGTTSIQQDGTKVLSLSPKPAAL